MRIKRLKGLGLNAGTYPSFVIIILLGLTLADCGTSKHLKKEGKTAKNVENVEVSTSSGLRVLDSSLEEISSDDHMEISAKPMSGTTFILDPIDSIPSLVQIDEEIKISSQAPEKKDLLNAVIAESASEVARQIVKNYRSSKNKEPGGHCLSVSKARFEKAYKDVYGHTFYQDLPDSMSRSVYSPREVFDFLYFSTSGRHDGWLSLPIQYRGKGNAGALAFAGMGTLVDWFGIWSGKLKPGAPMQVWKRRDDYELVVRGITKKEFDPFGHSFIFLEYVRDQENKITGIRIADQGYQSYRPLLPNDYEVWWAVNLSI